ncbi:MAG TPA: CPXCG motif-containing cysteine-rich protein [Gammaproteobacteria bacterium]|nr:CPXCG motif-containing cysteine-rich protein [Gammaproteobacteria bacterium]
MELSDSILINCPYCGEQIELEIDCTISQQEYVEDCQVCCQPISLRVTVGEEGEPQVEVRRENE